MALFITFSNSAHHTYSCIGTSGKNCQNPHEGVLVKTTAENFLFHRNLNVILSTLIMSSGYYKNLQFISNFYAAYNVGSGRRHYRSPLASGLEPLKDYHLCVAEERM